MKLPEVFERLLGREGSKRALEHADDVTARVEAIRVVVVPKNRRALAEIRRLEHAARQ